MLLVEEDVISKDRHYIIAFAYIVAMAQNAVTQFHTTSKKKQLLILIDNLIDDYCK